MINWLWAIPWIVIIIFYAGWHFGGKIATKKELVRKYQEEADMSNDLSINKKISELYEYLYNLESKIERLYATKEEKVNG